MTPRALAGALALLPALASARPSTAGWIVTNDDPAVKSLRRGADYNFANLFTHRYLTANKRLGADVGMEAKTPRNVELSKKDLGDPIRCGDAFSIKVDGAFLVFEREETSSANLALRAPEWAQRNDPHQWRVGACKEGDLVPLNKPIALVNVRRGDALVGCKRIYGAPYCWDDQQLLGVARE